MAITNFPPNSGIAGQILSSCDSGMVAFGNPNIGIAPTTSPAFTIDADRGIKIGLSDFFFNEITYVEKSDVNPALCVGTFNKRIELKYHQIDDTGIKDELNKFRDAQHAVYKLKNMGIDLRFETAYRVVPLKFLQQYEVFLHVACYLVSEADANYLRLVFGDELESVFK